MRRWYVPAMVAGIPLRAVRTALFGVMIAFVVLPVALLPYRADDVINRVWATRSAHDQISGAWSLVIDWMHKQGRFFPGAASYALVVWNTFTSRASYAFYLALLDLLLIALVVLIAWRTTRSPHLAALAGLATGACMQIQFSGFDGIAGFAGLVVYTIILTLLSSLAAAHILSGGSRWWAVAVAVPWTLAVTSYEVSLLMLPAILLMLWAVGPPVRAARGRWAWAIGPLLIPAAGQVLVTALLRTQASKVVPAYELNFGGAVGGTSWKQFTAALPLSQEVFASAPFDRHLALLLVVTIGVPTFLAWRPWVVTAPHISRRVAWALVVAGAWAWVIPSLLAGVTLRWQESLVWGQGYIYLAYEYVGIALILTGVTALVARHAPGRAARVTFAVLFGVVVVGCALAIATNLVAAGVIVPGPTGPS